MMLYSGMFIREQSLLAFVGPRQQNLFTNNTGYLCLHRYSVRVRQSNTGFERGPPLSSLSRQSLL